MSDYEILDIYKAMIQQSNYEVQMDFMPAIKAFRYFKGDLNETCYRGVLARCVRHVLDEDPDRGAAVLEAVMQIQKEILSCQPVVLQQCDSYEKTGEWSTIYPELHLQCSFLKEIMYSLGVGDLYERYEHRVIKNQRDTFVSDKALGLLKELQNKGE